MSKNIIACSDGTGGTAIKARGTNVFKLYEALDRQGQIAIYDDGVGAQRLRFLRIASGAVGIGLKRNVRQLYVEIARAYEPGDRIYLFGFSRGAFTVRMLAGLIARCGILDKRNPEFKSESDFQRVAREAINTDRSRYDIWWRRLYRDRAEANSQSEKFRKRYAVADDRSGPTPIAFIGVWDTVDAYGFPVDAIAGFWDKHIYPFRFDDQTLSPKVERACQALSIDDVRHTFHPVLWEDDPRIEQVWFAGVHTNVGGGYPKQGMSLVSLNWMMEQAERQRLRFVESDREFYREHMDVHDHLYDSRAAAAIYYRYNPRDIEKICNKWTQEVTPKIHISAIERMLQGTEGYAPGNIPKSFEIAWDTRTREQVRSAAERLRQEWPGNLLNKSSSSISRRRFWEYWGLLIFTMLALLASLFDEWSETNHSVSGSLMLVWQKGLLNNLFWPPWLPIVFGLFYFIDTLEKSKQIHGFTRDWQEARRKVWKQRKAVGAGR
jgi:uncharacterized protein (DUF2235 family)